MSEPTASLLQAVALRLASLREYRAMYDRELALSFDPIRQFWGLSENTSSAILAYFLDPKASHAQGNVFLREFLSFIAQKTDNAKLVELAEGRLDVKCEFVIPNPGPSDGGRPDIVLQFSSPDRFCIAIENKIWAIDQERQLERYLEYLEGSYSGTHMLAYLTHDGHEPSEGSITRARREEKASSLCFLSWNEDISKLIDIWAGLCHADRVRAFLKDFQCAIHNEMGGGLDVGEVKAVVDQIVKSGDSISSAMAIVNSWESALTSLWRKFDADMKEEARKNSLNFWMEFQGKIDDIGFALSRSEWQHFKISFDFNANPHRDMTYGILYRAQNTERSQEVMKAGESVLAGFKEISAETKPPNDFFAVEFSMEADYRDWETEQVLTCIHEGRQSKLFESIWGKVTELAKIIDEKEETLRQ